MTTTTKYIRETLSPLYPPGELRSMIHLIMTAVCHLTSPQQILCKDRKITEKEKNQITAIVERLKNHEPIQYILCETQFYSLPIQVNPSVLIPRPETEELVDLILTSTQDKSLQIIDIGTGSGCIAIALAKHLPSAQVFATDISDPALQTAVTNAKLNHTAIQFIQSDILDTPSAIAQIPGMFHLIVNNPPYITNQEKETMEPNVLNYEPHQALFVPDNDPLLYYKAIARFARRKLAPEGLIYLEINPLYDLQICRVLHESGFLRTEIIRDLSGKNRMIKAQKADTGYADVPVRVPIKRI